jgi:hypothetical protein
MKNKTRGHLNLSHAVLGVIVAFAAIACDPEDTTHEDLRDAELTERATDMQATDMSDPATNPTDEYVGVAGLEGAGFPGNNCRSGFIQAGPRLCIDEEARQPKRYRRAVLDCRNSRSNVCSVEDLHYLYFSTNFDADYNPRPGNRRSWLGNVVGDSTVLCGDRSITTNNDPDIHNFDGVCDANERQPYWCCHDDVMGGGGGNQNDDDGYDDDDGY